MKPILFESNETEFVSNGLGRIDAVSCLVTEERNGQYDLEMEVSIDDEHYPDIVEGRILYVRHDESQDKQPFDIYYISRPLNGIVTVLAHHISYRTQGITVSPFQSSSVALTFVEMKSHSVGDNPFTFWTDKVVNAPFELEQPKTLRSMLAGEEGSILDAFGSGEYEWDKFSIKLHLHRGVDSGVVIRYGKDLTELKKVTDASNVWTGVVPFWRGTRKTDTEGDGTATSDEEVVVMLTEKCIMSPHADLYPQQVIVPLDMSQYFEDVPTEEQLREKATDYVNTAAPSSIPTTIEFSFINTASLEEYKNVAALQRLKLCDTVTVKYDKLGVSNTAQIIRTVFDVLAEKYRNVTVGDVAPDLSTSLTSGIKDSINDLQKETRRSIGATRSRLEQEIQQSIDDQTALITGGTGGHVVLRRDADGKPTDILIMDDEDVEEAVNVLRLNVNGIGFSKTGVDGPYANAWTIDGKFHANFIQTGELDAGLVKVNALSDANGTNYWNMETGDFRLASTTKVGPAGTTDTIASLLTGLANQIDAKIETWAKSTNPASEWTTAELMEKHDGDLWLYTGMSNITVGTTTIHPQGVYQYDYNDGSPRWVAYSSTGTNLFDLADGKSAIFYGTYRTGSSSNYTPSNNDVSLAAGDMRYYGSTTYICTDAQNGTWATFSGADEGDYFVDKHTGSTYRWSGNSWSKVTDYKSAIASYDSALDQTSIFNKLTNNGAVHGIFMQNNELYVNASYVQSGTLKLGGANNADGQLEIKNASGTVIGRWNKDGITVNSGSINIGNGNFAVDTTGKMTCSGASITGGAIESSGTVNSLPVKRTMSVASDSFTLSGTKVLDSAWKYDSGYQAYDYRQIIYGSNGYAITLGNGMLSNSSGLFITKNNNSAHKDYVGLRSINFMAVVEGYTATLSSNDTSEGFVASVTAKKDTVDLGCAKLTVNNLREGRTVDITIDGTVYHFEKGILTTNS